MKDHNFLVRAAKGRPNRAQIWNDTYHCGFMVVWPVTSETFRDEAIHLAKCKGINLKDCEFGISEGGGRLLLKDGANIMGLGCSKPSVGLIAHECLHWANRCLGERDIPSTYEEDEAQAYLMAWAVERVWEVINK